MFLQYFFQLSISPLWGIEEKRWWRDFVPDSFAAIGTRPKFPFSMHFKHGSGKKINSLQLVSTIKWVFQNIARIIYGPDHLLYIIKS